jgi:hypothetical protein
MRLHPPRAMPSPVLWAKPALHSRRRFGDIQSIKLRTAPGKHTTDQYALIAFGSEEEAQRAFLALNAQLIPDLCDMKKLKCKFSPGKFSPGKFSPGKQLDDSQPTTEECESGSAVRLQDMAGAKAAHRA